MEESTLKMDDWSSGVKRRVSMAESRRWKSSASFFPDIPQFPPCVDIYIYIYKLRISGMICRTFQSALSPRSLKNGHYAASYLVEVIVGFSFLQIETLLLLRRKTCQHLIEDVIVPLIFGLKQTETICLSRCKHRKPQEATTST